MGLLSLAFGAAGTVVEVATGTTNKAPSGETKAVIKDVSDSARGYTTDPVSEVLSGAAAGRIARRHLGLTETDGSSPKTKPPKDGRNVDTTGGGKLTPTGGKASDDLVDQLAGGDPSKTNLIVGTVVVVALLFLGVVVWKVSRG